MHSPLRRLTLCTMIFGTLLLTVATSLAQDSAQQAAVTTTAPISVVPHLIKFSAALPNAPGKAEVVDVKFSLYAAQTGGEALWTETQQVSLDAAGKYSVLLGSATALPSAVFANGQARWIGVTLGSDQESPRTVLVATPYSLKASDSETLGGHPASDFTLKNAQSPSGTDITQINVGNGVTGGGTGPTVTLGLSSSYLENLGNEIYPQLTGTNVLSGKNTYSAGKLLIGSSPVLSAANIVAGSDINLAVSGSNVTIGVNGPALLSLGNGYYPQLTANNSFSGANTFSKAMTFASGQTFPGTATLAGNNTFAGTNAFSKAITFASGQTFPGVPTLSGANTFTGLVTINGTEASGTVIPNITAQFTTNDTSNSSTAVPLAIQGSTSIGIGVEGNGAIGLFGYGTTPGTGNYVSYGVEGEGNNVGGIFYAPDNGSGASLNGVGVVATAYNGVTGYGDAATGVGVIGAGFIGMQGSTGTISDIGNYYNQYFTAIGQQGDSNATRGIGVLATADDGYSLIVANNSPSGYTTLDVENNDTTGSAYVFGAFNIHNGTECSIDHNANLSCSGTASVIHSVGDRQIKTYGVQSAENWIEDFGSGQLASGSTHVSLDATFAATVNTGDEYHVFITPRGDSEGLYVANAGPGGFDVKESHSGRSNVGFDYRIVAKRKGFENVRMEDITAEMAKQKAHHDEMLKHGALAAKRPKVTLPAVSRTPRINPTHATTVRSAIEP